MTTSRTRGRDMQHALHVKNEYKILIAKPEGKRPQGKSIRGVKNNIKINREKTGCKGLDQIFIKKVQQLAFISMALNLNVT